MDRDVGLCLSGGGYRAMLFHAGALTRLNDAALLPRLTRVSSVSGGSIAAGVLAQRWDELTFDDDGRAANFRAAVFDRLIAFAGRGMDINAVLGAFGRPGHIADRAAKLFRKRLFGDTTLGDLSASGPEFVFAATNLETGALWYFSKDVVGDYVSGVFKSPATQLATAVGASAAFPPVLSPAILRFGDKTVRLSDGGVYDNLGLQPLADRTGKHGIKYVLASDGGQPFKFKPRPSAGWILGTIHVLSVVDFEVRKLRRGDLIADFTAKPPRRRGTYWGIDTELADYVKDTKHGNKLAAADLLPVNPEKADELARLRTRLKAVPAPLQNALVNWGYAVCDTALRKYVWKLPRGSFPLDGGV